MNVGPTVAPVAALIGEPTRASVLAILSDGRARTATELSYAVGVSAQSVSGHIAKLLDGRLLKCNQQGRYRYYRLASIEVANALEALMVVTSIEPTGLKRFGPRDEAMCKARMCYDHVAGSLGARLADTLIDYGALLVMGDDFEITTKGERLLSRLEIDLKSVRSRRRVFARCCMDWSERRPHIAGALGAELASRFLEFGWLTRTQTNRTLCITAHGVREFGSVFSIDVSDLK